MSSKVYIGARSFALKGTLLSRRTMETLAESTSLEELVNRLRETPYSAPLSKIQPPFTARRLELAFRERFADVQFTLMRAASNFELLKLYYMKNVAWNVKLALKSKALGKSYEESIEYIDLHSEELIGRRELIARVLSAQDVQEAATLMSGSEFGPDIEKAVLAFTNTNEVRFFDVYVDHAVLSKIAKMYLANPKFHAKTVDIGSLGEIIALDIDSYNLLSILRAMLWGLQGSELKDLIIQPTFRASLPLLDRLIASESTAEAVKLVQDLYSMQQPVGNDEELINAVEEMFLQESLRVASRAFFWQKLGPTQALAMTKLIEFETRNLSAISVGIELGLPATAILSKLKF